METIWPGDRGCAAARFVFEAYFRDCNDTSGGCVVRCAICYLIKCLCFIVVCMMPWLGAASRDIGSS
jgi:hypothetical protein